MPDITKIEEGIYKLEDCITIPEAVKLTGITNVTLITWCRKYHIGRKIGGRWRVHPERLALLLEGALKG